jgi:hypothetical protein
LTKNDVINDHQGHTTQQKGDDAALDRMVGVFLEVNHQGKCGQRNQI